MKKDNGLFVGQFQKYEDELHIMVENNGEDISGEELRSTPV